jgi:hypothetical protein
MTFHRDREEFGMASISEREGREIEAGNASGTTPLVFMRLQEMLLGSVSPAGVYKTYKGVWQMAGVHKVSEQMIEVAERLSNVADAVEGKRMARRGNGLMGWVLLPAAGAGLYALVKSDFFTRQAKDVVDEAKSRASDLPNDLMKSVRQTTQKSPSRSSTTQSTRSRSGSQRRRKTSAARKIRSARKGSSARTP